jgi:hypothetical protein
MKTRVWVLIGIVVVIVLALIFLETQTQMTPLSLQGSSQQVGVSTSTITASTTDYTVDASYPQFGIPAIDSQIKATVVSAEQDLISQAEQDQPVENGYSPYNFTSLFDSAYIGPDYVSVRLVLSDYTDGAHENPLIVGETFDRATGQPVTLDQALALTGKTLDQVAQEAKQQLAQNPDTAPTGMWASGSDPTTDNYQEFLINQSDVIFIFNPYQVAPFSSGAPEVSIARIK